MLTWVEYSKYFIEEDGSRVAKIAFRAILSLKMELTVDERFRND
jgi:hypothetical protein